MPACDGQSALDAVTAAVLVPIHLRGGEPHLVLTRRDARLSSHAGEICFPGGRYERIDASLVDTALREAEEEIGLARSDVQVLGGLSRTSTFVTNYTIYPFVGTFSREEPSVEQPSWTVCATEVDAVLDLPLRTLRSARTKTTLTRKGFTFETDAYLLDEHMIWGATARVLDDLLRRVDPLL